MQKTGTAITIHTRREVWVLYKINPSERAFELTFTISPQLVRAVISCQTPGKIKRECKDRKLSG